MDHWQANSRETFGYLAPASYYHDFIIFFLAGKLKKVHVVSAAGKDNHISHYIEC